MPPPMMTTRGIRTVPRCAQKTMPPRMGAWQPERLRYAASLHHLSQGSRKCGRAVQTFGARQRDASLGRIAAEQYVDIVQDFHVIAHEADGCDHHFAHAFGGVAVEAGFHGWPQPRTQRRTAAHPLALESELPIGKPQAGRYRSEEHTSELQ